MQVFGIGGKEVEIHALRELRRADSEDAGDQNQFTIFDR